MSKYKVGDKVIITKDNPQCSQLRSGEVVKLSFFTGNGD